MNKQYLTLTAIGLLVLFSLDSCINKDYDWDNLNKEITFEIGNVPLGNVSPIRIDSLLEDRGDDIKFSYDASGYVSLLYKGEVEIDIPKFNRIENVEETSKQSILNNKLSVSTSIPSNTNIELINGDVDYKISAPNNNNNEWQIDVTSVTFESCELNINLYMTDIVIPERKTNLQVALKFPESIIFADDIELNDNRVWEKIIDPSLITSNNGSYTLASFPISKFDYETENEKIEYSVYLKIDEEFTPIFNSEKSLFYILFTTPQPQADTVYANTAFLQEIPGDIDGIGDLNDIFQDGDSFTLKNPGMNFSLTTNIEYDFNISIDELIAKNGNEATTMENVTKDGMIFEKENVNKTTSYFIAKTNDHQKENFKEADLNEVLDVKPNILKYKITARTNGEKLSDNPISYTTIPGSFPYKDPEIKAEYEFELPFDFTSFNVSFEEMMDDVFSEDIADKLFNNEGDFIIAADEVIVQLGGGDSSAKANVKIKVTVYDYNDEPILSSNEATLQNGKNKLEITIPVTKKDIPQMKNAKHLGFDFRIDGKNMKLNKSDHITINKLKFKSTAGISWEF